MGNQFQKHVNDFSTWCEQNDRKDLLLAWNWEKNTPLTPENTSFASGEKVWWLCKYGHEWNASLDKARKSRGCPYCLNRKLLPGYNDFQTKYPELANEWHPTKNPSLSPDNVMGGSGKKIWWLGRCGHEWEATLNSRTTNNSGCPFCAGQRLIVGVNDLQTKYPDIASEWHPTKNGDLRPDRVMSRITKRVWWQGKCGHEWEARVADRSSGRGCPICNSETHTSFPEQAILFYVRKYYPDAKNGDRTILHGIELDIYIPSLKVGIEYNGSYWHKGAVKIAKDERKRELCNRQRIRLIGIVEKTRHHKGFVYDDYIVRDNSWSDESLTKAIIQLFNTLNPLLSVDIDVGRDQHDIRSIYVKKRKEQSLAVLYPVIASEWHPSKNGNLTPDKVMSKNGKKAWWLGKCGHEWSAVVAHRTLDGRGCPYCSNQKALSGFNDLATKVPELLDEWDYEKNQNLKDGNGDDISTPDKVVVNSCKKVWWKCKICDYEWTAQISSRIKGHGCPRCSGNQKKTQEEFVNEMKQIKPWIEIREMYKGSHVKIKVSCRNCGFEWDSSPTNLLNTNRLSKCKMCGKNLSGVGSDILH